VEEKAQPQHAHVQLVGAAQPEVVPGADLEAVDPVIEDPAGPRGPGGRRAAVQHDLDAIPPVSLHQRRQDRFTVRCRGADAPAFVLGAGEFVAPAGAIGVDAVLVHARVVDVGIESAGAVARLDPGGEPVGAVGPVVAAPQQRAVTGVQPGAVLLRREVEAGFPFHVPARVDHVVRNRQRLDQIGGAPAGRHEQAGHVVAGEVERSGIGDQRVHGRGVAVPVVPESEVALFEVRAEDPRGRRGGAIDLGARRCGHGACQQHGSQPEQVEPEAGPWIPLCAHDHWSFLAPVPARDPRTAPSKGTAPPDPAG